MFKPEFAGKMNFYLSAVDDQIRHPDDGPSSGIILCKSRNELIVEYALWDTTKPMGVSQLNPDSEVAFGNFGICHVMRAPNLHLRRKRFFLPQLVAFKITLMPNKETRSGIADSDNRRKRLKRIKDSQSTEAPKIAVMAAHRRLMLQCQSC